MGTPGAWIEDVVWVVPCEQLCGLAVAGGGGIAADDGHLVRVQHWRTVGLQHDIGCHPVSQPVATTMPGTGFGL